MPLVTCPDCGGPVSTEAAACPTCGRPNRQIQPARPPQQNAPTGGPTLGGSMTQGFGWGCGCLLVLVAIIVILVVLGSSSH